MSNFIRKNLGVGLVGRGRILLIGGFLCVTLAILWVMWSSRFLFVTSPPARINSLPPDEELIAHFYKHRSDIEELVSRYRSYVPPLGKEHGEWEKLGNTPDLLRRAGVRYIKSIHPTWLPEPYSLEARKHDKGIVANWREAAKYQTLSIQPLDARFYHNIVWKDLVFMPVAPRIENGTLIGPIDHLGRNYKSRVFPTLNKEPPDVGRDTCALHKIEDQWFVRMCRVIY